MFTRSNRILLQNRISPKLSCGRFFSSVVAATDAPSTVEGGFPVPPVIKQKNEKPRHKKGFKVGVKNINEAFDTIKELSWANFDETIECIVCLDVDPRKPNQSVRGVAVLPYGVGKTIRVGVFCRDADVQIALDAGADVVGAEDLIERVVAGDFPFDRVIATPEVMPLLAKIGRVFFK